MKSVMAARFSLWATLLLAITVPLAVVGCSNAEGYMTPATLTAISGIATLDGQPLAGATVTFVPKNGTQGTGGFGLTNDAGEFSAQHYSMEFGLEPGDYNVTFSRLQMPDGQPLAAGMDAADVGAVESLPTHLTRIVPDNHRYQLTVSDAPDDVKFELTSKR